MHLRLGLTLFLLGCSNPPRSVSPPPASPTPPGSPLAVVAPVASCGTLGTLAAYVVAHGGHGEGGEDRPAPEPTPEPELPIDPVERAEYEREAARIKREEAEYPDPLAGVTIGATCEITGKLAPSVGRILSTPAAPPRPNIRPATTPATPLRLADVAASLRLSTTETRTLAEHGLVALDRFAFDDYTTALYEVYRRDLPLYVGVDPILHAHYVAHDSFLTDLERSRLVPTTAYVIEALACKLPTHVVNLPTTTARDLDLYLTVARGLLAGAPVPSILGDADVTSKAATFVAKANAAEGLAHEPMFGRTRVIDWSQFRPRGHYTDDPAIKQLVRLPRARGKHGADDAQQLERYFRAVMWLSRVELDLGSSGCPVAAPGADPRPAERDTLVAYALAELVEAAAVGDAVETIDRAWAELAGPPEAVRGGGLAAVRKTAGVTRLTEPDAPSRLRKAVKDQFPRTVRTSYVAPDCIGPLPPVTSLIAPRIGPDAQAMMPLSQTDYDVSAAELGFALGHDRARAHLAKTDSGDGLAEARAILVGVRGHQSAGGIYGAWLDAILALADRPAGATPTFLDGNAGKDHRLESALVAYAQLRHDNVLLSAQTYSEDACSIPDGYVEPTPTVFRELATMADRSAALATAHGMPAWAAQWSRMAEIDRVLARIAEHELAGAPLTKDMLRFLDMIVEIHDSAGYGGQPSYNGWFFDLFHHDERDAFHPASLGIDVFTSVYPQPRTTTLGAAKPVLGVFTIDTNGSRRVVVGPIARATAGSTSLATRGSIRPDTDDGRGGIALVPWRSTYAVAEAPLTASIEVELELPENRRNRTVEVAIAPKTPGTYVVELLGGNRRPVATRKVTLDRRGVVSFAFPKALAAIHVSTGDSHAWLECRSDPDGGPRCDHHRLADE